MHLVQLPAELPAELSAQQKMLEVIEQVTRLRYCRIELVCMSQYRYKVRQTIRVALEFSLTFFVF